MEILLKIKSPYLQKYLEYIFEKKDGSFVVKRTEEFGRLLCSFFKKSEYPVKIEQTDETVRFILPKSCHISEIAERYYIYYDAESTVKLNDFLKTISDIDFREYCLSGKEQGIMQKDIIDAYIQSRGLIKNTDTLKKRLYRNEGKQLKALQIFLKNRLDYINKKIKENTNI